jgi:hypothetical protein
MHRASWIIRYFIFRFKDYQMRLIIYYVSNEYENI